MVNAMAISWWSFSGSPKKPVQGDRTSWNQQQPAALLTCFALLQSGLPTRRVPGSMMQKQRM